MDRIILLALLGIPVLVIIHVALFWQDLPPGIAMLSTVGGGQERPSLHGYWLSPERIDLPARYVIKQTSERGS
jgi:hypothetical protein